MAISLETFHMNDLAHRGLRAIGLGLCAVAMLTGAAGTSIAADDSQAVLRSDQALVRAMGSGDRGGADRFLDADFTWISSEGKLQTRAQVLENLPGTANADMEADAPKFHWRG